MGLIRWEKPPTNITKILQEERDRVINKFRQSSDSGNILAYVAGVDDLMEAITKRMGEK